MQDYIIYTDGGCAVNPGGPGAYGVVIIDCDTGEITEYSAGYISTTNNRMEIMAVLVALEHIPKGSSATLYSDSQYVINTICGKWRKTKNQDLWKRLDSAAMKKTIVPKWVKGHNGDRYNERCDAMCTEAMYKECLEVDSGYKGEVPSNIPVSEKTGAMGVHINISESFSTQIERMSVSDYSEKYGVHPNCAKSILDFSKSKNHDFKSYMMLKSHGSDSWSKWHMDELLKEKEELVLVCDYLNEILSNTKSVESCMRWYCRGLPLRDAIRKVLVDQEVSANAAKSYL